MYGSDPLGVLSWRFEQDEGGYGVSARPAQPQRRPRPHARRPDRARGRDAGRRSSPSGRCPQPGAGALRPRRAPAIPPAPVTNEDYVGALVRLRGRRATARSSRRARWSAPRARWPSTCTARRARSSWNLERLNELQVYLAGRRAATRATPRSSAATASRTTATSSRAAPTAIGFEDLIAIEDYEFLNAVAARRAARAGLRRRPRLRRRAGRPDPLVGVAELGGRRPPSREEARSMKTVRLTTAQAIVRFLIAQRTVIDGREAPLVPRRVRHLRPRQRHRASASRSTRRATSCRRCAGQNEQGMALAAVGYAKAMRRRQIMVATSSIGPGRDEHGHGGRRRDGEPAARAAALRRHVPEPHPRPGAAAGRALRLAVDDRQRRVPRRSRATGTASSIPRRCAQSLPLARRDDARPGGLRPGVHRPAPGRPGRGVRLSRRGCSSRACTSSAGQRPDARRAGRGRRRAPRGASARSSSPAAASTTRSPRTSSAAFVEAHGLPVVETVAGKSCLTADHPCYVGPIGVTGCDQREPAGRRGRRRALRRAPGCRTSRPARGRCSGTTDLTLIGLNAARFDATKHLALPVVGDAREGLAELGAALGDWRARRDWVARARGGGRVVQGLRRARRPRRDDGRCRPTRR